jgi:curli biogenesis system outer membrane secretion channel CsgG
MRRTIFFILVYILIGWTPVQAQAGLEQRVTDLSQKISTGLTENQKRTIAVVEFVDLRGNVTDFGRFMAEELITKLYETRKFKVIERQLLNRVMAEQKLSLTGVVDPTSAQKLGKLLGVDAIASGTITDLGTALRVNARLIDTSTAEIFAVASTEIAKDAAVKELVGSGESSGVPGDTNSSGESRRPLQRLDANFFTFELQRCLLSGTTVVCELVITNKGDDRQIGFGNKSRLFDDQGNEYGAEHIRLASKEGYQAEAVLVSGISVNLRLMFQGVSQHIRQITLLDVYVAVYSGGGKNFNVQFRRISLRPKSPGSAVSSEAEAAKVTALVQANEDRTINVSGAEQWTDTGIDVWPGMRIEVTASGRIYISSQHSASNRILGDLINRGTPLPARTVGPKALLAKIKYQRSGESKPLRVGESNTLIIQEGEQGRLFFGIDDKNLTDNSGSFTVRVKW